MGPIRKRPRTKPPKDVEVAGSPQVDDNTSEVTQASTAVVENTVAEDNTPSSLKDASSNSASVQQLNSKRSWYGTWPRKGLPSTQVARESILADKPINTSSTTDLGRYELRKSSVVADGRPPSMYLGKSKETSDVTMRGTLDGEDTVEITTTQEPKDARNVLERENSIKNTSKVAKTAEEDKTLPDTESSDRPATSSGWLGGWLGRPTVQPSEHEGNAGTSKSSEADQPILQNEPTETVADRPISPAAPPPVTTASTTWFGLWSTSAPSAVEQPAKEEVPVKLPDSESNVINEDSTSTKTGSVPAAGSTWAFWSTDATKKGTKPEENPKGPGELAVTGEASQNHPEPAKTTQKDKKGKSSKRGRPESSEAEDPVNKNLQLETPSSKATQSQSPAPAKPSPPNLLMPSVKSTYHLVENPSILQQIARLLIHGQQPPVKHVFLSKDPPKVKKAIAIGIHGLFPAPLLRTVIGQPTGTSIRFANHAAAAIRRWTDEHGHVDCEIEKVALEGEGKIAERVDNLWKLLLNWIEHVRKADFIMVACHSQGVPVALMLVAKLIEFGVVSTGRIGVCAMGMQQLNRHFKISRLLICLCSWCFPWTVCGL